MMVLQYNILSGTFDCKVNKALWLQRLKTKVRGKMEALGRLSRVTGVNTDGSDVWQNIFLCEFESLVLPGEIRESSLYSTVGPGEFV